MIFDNKNEIETKSNCNDTRRSTLKKQKTKWINSYVYDIKSLPALVKKQKINVSFLLSY